MSKKPHLDNDDNNPFKALDKNLFPEAGEGHKKAPQVKIKDRRKLLNGANSHSGLSGGDDGEDANFTLIMNMGGVAPMKDNNNKVARSPSTSANATPSTTSSTLGSNTPSTLGNTSASSSLVNTSSVSQARQGEEGSFWQNEKDIGRDIGQEPENKKKAAQPLPKGDVLQTGSSDLGTLRGLLDVVVIKNEETPLPASAPLPAGNAKERSRGVEEALLKEYLASSKNMKKVAVKEDPNFLSASSLPAMSLPASSLTEGAKGAENEKGSEKEKENAGSTSIEALAFDNDEQAFYFAMEKVTPIAPGSSAAKGRAVSPPPVAPAVVQPISSNFLQNFMDEEIEFSLSFTEEHVQGHVLGLDEAVINQMKAGNFSFEAYLDLHGQNTMQAFNSLVAFIKRSYEQGRRHVLIITGRGKNSPDGMGVLRDKTGEWLTAEPLRRVVLAFCTALPRHGGAGALYVLLRKIKKSRGKIMWDKRPSDPDLFI